MKTDKLIWNRPRTDIQVFEPNICASACYEISCSRAPGWHTHGLFSSYLPDYHDSSECGSTNNQVVRGDDSTGYSVVELRSGTRATGTTTEYSESSTYGSLSSVSAGQTIYWTNERWGITYHHYGTVGYSDPNRPNHS